MIYSWFHQIDDSVGFFVRYKERERERETGCCNNNNNDDDELK